MVERMLGEFECWGLDCVLVLCFCALGSCALVLLCSYNFMQGAWATVLGGTEFMLTLVFNGVNIIETSRMYAMTQTVKHIISYLNDTRQTISPSMGIPDIYSTVN